MSDFISVSSPQADRNLLLLIDTEAHISIIKRQMLNKNIKLNTNELISMKGITNERQLSLGSVNVILIFEHLSITHKIHIVSDDFPIPAHGILGKDFMKIHKCLIDFNEMTFTVRPKGQTQAKIPIQAEIIRGLSAVPPRSETFKIFRIKSTEFPCVIPAQEISENVCIPTTIVLQNECWIRVLNLNEDTKIISTERIKAASLEDFDILKYTKSTENIKRTAKLTGILTNKIPAHAREILMPMCLEFEDVFHVEGDKPTVNNFYTQTLRARENTPIYVKNYRLPQSQKVEINEQVKKLLKQDLIEMSKSSYNSPLIIVPKKSTDGTKKWRMCVDYRLLNRQLVPDKFPLPRIDEILDGLGRARFFTCLDLQAGYHQIPLDKNSRPMTAFSTEGGFFQWKVVPFGLNIAPASFTRMMTIAFSGLSPQQAFIYMDDLIVIGFSETQHLKNLKSVFETCRKFNLKLNPLKCEFFRSEVQFLGHKCTANGILPDPSKLNAVEKYPTPKDKPEVKRFVAFANYYRRFIRNFSGIARPLNELTAKRRPFIWSKECENAFSTLKKSLLSAPILAYPDFTKRFRVTVDASISATGAVLSQEIEGIDRPIAYISRAFKKGELNKPIIEKELIAIHFALTVLRPYLYGTEFTVFSDHKPLIYLYKLKNPSSKLTRIRLDLEEYKFEIVHIKGSENVVADALSRIAIDELKNQYTHEILAITRSMTKSKEQEQTKSNDNKSHQNVRVYESLKNGFDFKLPRIKMKNYTLKNDIVTHCAISVYKNHRKIFDCEVHAKPNKETHFKELLQVLESKAIINKFEILQWPLYDELFKKCTVAEFKKLCVETLKNITICLIPKSEDINDESKRMELLTTFHSDPIYGGHCGRKRLYANLRSRFYWPKMDDDVKNYVKNCHVCKLSKPGWKTKQPLKVTDTPSKPFDLVQIDTIGPMRNKSIVGNLYAVTIICELTKYLITIPITDKSAKTVADAIYKHFILVHGAMKKIKTDLGTEYINEIMTELCKTMQITHLKSTAYHHETLGAVERNHRLLNEYLRSYLNGNLESWDTYMQYFTFCYNITKSTTNGTNYSPFELVFGRQVNLPSDIGGPIQPLYNVDDYAKELKYRLQVAHRDTKSIVEKLKIVNKKFHDTKVRPIKFNVGDKIKIQVEPYDKFKSIYKGPYIVTKVENENLTINLNGKVYTLHKNRVLKY